VRTRFPASWWAPATAHGVSGALHRPEVLSVPRAWARGLFNKETFGEDRLVKGKISSPGFLEKAPLSDTARRDISGSKRIRSTICRASLRPKKARLSRISYRDYLLDLAKVDPSVFHAGNQHAQGSAS
jgi:hypothetical protein